MVDIELMKLKKSLNRRLDKIIRKDIMLEKKLKKKDKLIKKLRKSK